MDALQNTGLLDNGGLVLAPKPLDGAGDLMALLIDELACGVMILTLEGKTLHVNEVARTVLARSQLLEGGDLPCDAISDNGKAMAFALARVAEGKRSLVSLAIAGHPLAMAAVPLKGEPGTPTRVALIFSRTAIHDSLMLVFFARSHGLTPTEEHVLGIVCQGYTAPEVAKQMNVAVSTVRSHVRSMCAKTRSCGMRGLVNRVAMLPPVAPASVQEKLH